jgi:hypothetical protein
LIPASCTVHEYLHCSLPERWRCMFCLFCLKKSHPAAVVKEDGSAGYGSFMKRSNGVMDEWSIEKHLSGCFPGMVYGKSCWCGLPGF